MPKKHAKPFVDKKKSVAFRLVHRSQRDPLIAADDHELVLAPIDDVRKLQIQDSDEHDAATRKEKLIKYGVYFDDDYNYLQHLKDANEVYCLEDVQERYRINAVDGRCIEAGRDILPQTSGNSKLELPSSLFESRGVVLKTGLLNQAAPLPGPHPELDPDVVAALDADDYDFDNPDNQLEDDFILKANTAGSSSEDVENEDTTFAKHRWAHESDEDSDEDDDDDLDSLKHFHDSDNEETRSRFTNYSLTSSVMRRSAGLKTVDAIFEKLYEQYDDDQLGELDSDEGDVEGLIPPESQRVMQMLEEYEADLAKEKTAAQHIVDETGEQTVQKLSLSVDDYDEDDIEKLFVDEKPKEKWDCESILSTYSTLYNHPTVISEPSRKRLRANNNVAGLVVQIDPKSGLPAGLLRSATLRPVLDELIRCDGMEVAQTPGSVRSRASTVRSRFESSEERRFRKRAVKVERRERRQEKKLNKSTFRVEELKAAKEQINAKHANMNSLV